MRLEHEYKSKFLEIYISTGLDRQFQVIPLFRSFQKCPRVVNKGKDFARDVRGNCIRYLGIVIRSAILDAFCSLRRPLRTEDLASRVPVARVVLQLGLYITRHIFPAFCFFLLDGALATDAFADNCILSFELPLLRSNVAETHPLPLENLEKTPADRLRAQNEAILRAKIIWAKRTHRESRGVGFPWLQFPTFATYKHFFLPRHSSPLRRGFAACSNRRQAAPSGSHSSGIVFVGPRARTTASKARPGRVKQDARCPTRQHRARHMRTARHASTTRGAPPQAVVVPGSGSEVASHGQCTCGVASDAPWRARPLRAQAEPARRPRILLSCRAHGAPAPGRGFYISPWVIAEHTPTATGVALVPGFRTASRRTTVLRAGATSEEHPQLLFACACTRGATVSGNNWSAASSSVHGSCTAQAPPPAPAPELTCGPRATFLWHDVHVTCVFSRWVRNGGREAGRWSAAYAAIGASVRAASSHLSAPTRRGDPSSGADRDICVQGRSALSLVRRWNASAAKSEKGTFSL
ncbi:hypothetical protein B0H14DRAFT_3160140 [Mycena olivaceomarginata]|nr:hypothetical protein B0H14DRAFT_3160140 [Mycena olivaceomarginata]